MMDHRSATGWHAAIAMGLAIAALLVSAYLTYAHFASGSVLACPAGGTVNCERVTSSAQSTVAGIPVAVLGLAWASGMIALTVPAAWRSKRPEVAIARLALATGGMAFVLWLVYAELFVIGAICLWCTAVHVVAFALFVLLMIDAARRQAR